MMDWIGRLTAGRLVLSPEESRFSRTACGIVLVSSALAFNSSWIVSGGQQTTSPIPSGQLSFGAFTARFVPDGTFVLEGQGWPAFNGSWKADGGHIELLVPKGV